MGCQLRAQLLDRSAGTSGVACPRPLLVFHGLASGVQPVLMLLPVHFRADASFFLWHRDCTGDL